MPKKAWVEDRLYMDEAEGFLLSHALFSPPRTWPPLPPEPSQSARLQSKAKKMDWEDEARRLPLGEDEDALDTRHSKEEGSGSEGEANKERCVICLMELRDRTIVGVCGHEFCFECIGVWANQSRRCPLCSADMAPFLLHDLDNPTPTKFYLPPLPSRQIPSISLPGPSRRVMERSHPAFEKVEPDELDLQIERRREIYRQELYCKHIGSNPTTRYRPNPTPHEIANSPLLVQRATSFLRRELRVWTQADVEYLTTHILSLIKAVDIRSDVAVRLLAEFLDPPTSSASAQHAAFTHSVGHAGIRQGAEHFAHELYSWLRSPFKELRQWDLVAQYDTLPTENDEINRKPNPETNPAEASSSPQRISKSRSKSPISQSSRSSRSPSPLSRSPSPYSSRSRSRSRSPYSRSPSPSRPPRDPSRPDTFIAPRSPGEKAWNEPDTWLDPEYANWLDEERRRAEERVARKRARRETWEARRNGLVAGAVPGAGMRAWGGVLPTGPMAEREQVELLPDYPDSALQMDAEPLREVDIGDEQNSTVPGLTIKGAAAGTDKTRRLSLLERLAKAKAEAAGVTLPPTLPPLPENPAEINAEDLLEHPIALEPISSADPTAPTARRSTSVSGLTATVRARLRLRLKLESERANWRHNIAESKAQELRRRLLEAKVIRQAEETDAVLRRMDRLDWQREIRRRLMVEKMMAAETEGERRARELKERLGKEKRRRMLRGVLMARKKSISGKNGAVGVGVVAEAGVDQGEVAVP